MRHNSKIIIVKAVVSFFLLTISYQLLATKVSAQKIDLSVNPPHLELFMKPDVSVLTAVTLENLGDPVVISARVVSFEPTGDQGERIIKDKAEGPLRFSLENSDLVLGEKVFLPQKKKIQLLLKTRSIENATNGDYYYMVVFKTEPPTLATSAGRGSAEIAANILVSISDTGIATVDGKIAQFAIVPRYKFNLFGKRFDVIEPGDEVPVVLKIANTGNYLIAPEAEIKVQGPYGTTLKQKLVPVNVLRGSERLITQEEEIVCSRCTTPVSTVFHGFFLGKYGLSADISFQNAQQKVFASTEFWALPVQLTKVVAMLFGISIFTLVFVAKNKRRK